MDHIHSSMMYITTVCIFWKGRWHRYTRTHIIFVLFELVKQYLAPKTSKIIQALLQRYPWKLWEVVDCLAQDVTRCGSLPLIRNTSRSQTSSTWLLATSRIYVGLQHNDLEWYDQVYWDGGNREYAGDMIRWYKTFQFSDVCVIPYDLKFAVYM